jgi:hypothetical protein
MMTVAIFCIDIGDSKFRLFKQRVNLTKSLKIIYKLSCFEIIINCVRVRFHSLCSTIRYPWPSLHFHSNELRLRRLPVLVVVMP